MNQFTLGKKLSIDWLVDRTPDQIVWIVSCVKAQGWRNLQRAELRQTYKG